MFSRFKPALSINRVLADLSRGSNSLNSAYVFIEMFDSQPCNLNLRLVNDGGEIRVFFSKNCSVQWQQHANIIFSTTSKKLLIILPNYKQACTNFNHIIVFGKQ